MRKISPETEKKLLRVIDKTASLVEGGDAPDDAIIKAAMEYGLRQGDIPPVVHAYNTGRTLRQRKDGDDIFSKVADFKLADAENIMSRLYPATVKKAAAEDTTVSPEYTYSPQPMLARKAQAEKRATNINWRAIGGEEITAAPPLPQFDDKYEQARTKMAKLKRTTEESRRKAAAAFDQMGETFMELSGYFQRTDAKPLPVVKEAAILLHGDKGEQIFNELVIVSPSLMKLANHRIGNSLLGPACREQFSEQLDNMDCVGEPFTTVNFLVENIGEYNRLKAAAAADLDAYEKEAAILIAPFSRPAVSQSILGTSSEDAVEKTATFLDGPLQALGAYSLVNNTMLKPIADKIAPGVERADNDEQKIMESLNDPSHEAELRAINSQATLQDLMSNDEVISGYSPDEVASAYNDIVQISPSVADQRMLVQNLLRKSLQQGQLDTFEQDQLLGFEDKLRKQNSPMGKGDTSAKV